MRRLPACLLFAALLGGAAPAAAQQPAMSARVQEILKAATEARAAGDDARQKRILEEGIATVGEQNDEAYHLYGQLGSYYADLGNIARAGALAEKMYDAARNPGQEFEPAIRGLAIYSGLHDKEKVRLFAARVEALAPRLRNLKGWHRFGDLWQAGMAWAKAGAARATGHPEDAENAFKACLTSAERYARDAPERPGGWFYLVDCTTGLMQTQIATGQLAAAGAVADQLRAAIDRLTQVARRPAIAARVGGVLGQLALEQGRVEDARRIFLDTLAKFEANEEGDKSLRVAALQLQLAQLEMLRGRWHEAREWHRKRGATLRALGRERGAHGPISPDYAYTLIRLGYAGEALEMMRRIAQARAGLYDDNALPLWEGRAYLGIALAAAGQRDEALRELQAAIPRMLDIMKGERSSSDAGALRTARLNWLLDGYLMLLADRAADGAHPEAEAAMDEAFRMADLARGSTVQRALAAAASRAGIDDPALAALARREQDLQREIASFAESVGNLLARGRIAEQDRIVADLRAELARLRGEHAQVQAEIERRFPDYAALLDPKPVGIAAIRKLLKPTEAVVAVYAGGERTLVWAIPAAGAARFAAVPLTGEQLDLKVKTLREALDPQAEIAGRLPKYHFDLAHELYLKLLAPVADGWRDAREIIVIPHGRLGQLPFGVLVTAPFSAKPARLPYAEMDAAPWLIKQVAISQLPAAVALPALRARAGGAPAERPFVGFGDPLFVAASTAAPAAAARGLIRRRNLPAGAVPGAAGAEPGFSPPIDFRLLPPLPDTAQEIEEVARVLAADRARDIFLRERASEARAKQTDLSPYRVVMFATHGLTGGELPGVYQPALALANPALSGDGEDGMLTMEEILALKLGADWVVLSACNTAAADGQSGESVSGLGRAFFYAGAKSLLVTNWAVETESARLLTTDAFRRQAADPGLSRARALQQSALALMKQSAGKDYSYAHPMFWAPYTLVGDGG